MNCPDRKKPDKDGRLLVSRLRMQSYILTYSKRHSDNL